MPYIQSCYHHTINLCTDLLDSAMEIVELYKCVLVIFDDTCILETDHCDEQTDTGWNCLLQALRHRYRNVLTKSGYRKNQEYNTGQEYDYKTCLITCRYILSCEERTCYEDCTEEGIESHSTCLCKRHICNKCHQQRTDDCYNDGCDVNRIPDLSHRSRIRP